MLSERYTQTYTPTVVQGEEGWLQPLPWVFAVLQCLENILPLIACHVIYEIKLTRKTRKLQIYFTIVAFYMFFDRIKVKKTH